jgi:tetratricopeptide (TPR) repeat protein/tRNA A-37 threonylcarbamoyl transferase component Bud32
MAHVDRDLLFGLLALQNGLIDQVQLVAAFQAWTLDKARGLAEHLISLGHLSDAQRAVVAALADLHVAKHGDVERSLAAIPAGRSTRESLARLGDPDIEGTLAHIRSRSTQQDGETDADRTATYSVGTATTDGERFRVLRPHAQGGLGAVFVALDTELHREVAVKQILDRHADDLTSRQRFLLEAEITGGLEHPGIVPVYGLGTYGAGRPYYAMRFVRGDSLKEAIEQFHAARALKRDPGKRSLELRSLLRRFTDVCNAIDYAHSRGVLHRDIKPGNIIIGKHGETLVVDWGLAKATGRSEPGSGERTLVPSSASGSSETLPGSALGTPAYMSPEQAEGNFESLGRRSDVYSLGATLYCLLTGRPPFAGDAGEVIPAVQKGQFPPPRSLDSSIDRALEAVCLKAMAVEPGDRYGSCRALAEDIERWMADEPVSAWREPFVRRARRWARRNRTAVTAAAVALLAGLTGLSSVAAVQARANAALRMANRATHQALTETREAQRKTDAALADTRQAQAATKAALAQSEDSRKQAEAVSSFLVSAFRSPDPAQDGRQVKVADVMDRASEQLDKEFAGSPATKGALLEALGRTYDGLGLYDRALSLHSKAGDVREAALGPDHPDTLTSRSNLGVALLSVGRLREAIALDEATLKLQEAKLGPDHRDTNRSRSSLAIAYQESGRTDDAIALYEVTLKLREAKLGPDHRDTLDTRNNLATAYADAGRLSEAISMFERVLKLEEAKLGADHPDTLGSRSNLALAYHQAGRTAEAIALEEATLKIREAKLGPDHPDTLDSRNNLAGDYRDAGRLSEAIALYESTLKLREAKLGLRHPRTLSSRANLAGVYKDAGRLSEAVALHESTLKLLEATLGPDHPVTVVSRAGLAGTYQALGRFDEAEGLSRDTLSRRRKTVKPDSPSMADDLILLAGHLLMRLRWSEAEPLLRECLAIRQKAAPDEWSRFDTMSLLGGALLGQGRCAEAEPLIVPGYEGMKAREARIPVPDRSRLLDAAERVVRLYEAWGKPAQAASWKTKLCLPDLPSDVFAGQ